MQSLGLLPDTHSENRGMALPILDHSNNASSLTILTVHFI